MSLRAWLGRRRSRALWLAYPVVTAGVYLWFGNVFDPYGEAPRMIGILAAASSLAGIFIYLRFSRSGTSMRMGMQFMALCALAAGAWMISESENLRNGATRTISAILFVQDQERCVTMVEVPRAPLSEMDRFMHQQCRRFATMASSLSGKPPDFSGCAQQQVKAGGPAIAECLLQQENEPWVYYRYRRIVANLAAISRFFDETEAGPVLGAWVASLTDTGLRARTVLRAAQDGERSSFHHIWTDLPSPPTILTVPDDMLWFGEASTYVQDEMFGEYRAEAMNEWLETSEHLVAGLNTLLFDPSIANQVSPRDLRIHWNTPASFCDVLQQDLASALRSQNLWQELVDLAESEPGAADPQKDVHRTMSFTCLGHGGAFAVSKQPAALLGKHIPAALSRQEIPVMRMTLPRIGGFGTEFALQKMDLIYHLAKTLAPDQIGFTSWKKKSFADLVLPAVKIGAALQGDDYPMTRLALLELVDPFSKGQEQQQLMSEMGGLRSFLPFRRRVQEFVGRFRSSYHAQRSPA